MVLLKKTSFIVDRFNILLSVHQVVHIFLYGARRRYTVVLGKEDGRVVRETKHFVSLPPHLLVIIGYI